MRRISTTPTRLPLPYPRGPRGPVLPSRADFVGRPAILTPAVDGEERAAAEDLGVREREKEISCQFRRKVRVCRGGRVRLTEKAELIDSTEYAELRERREDNELTDSTEKREFTDTRENNPMPARETERGRERREG